jgi:RNA ligase (TIGR02306 family)
MSNYEVMTYPVKIVDHPNADLLEIAQIGDYQSCVLKGELSEGQTVAYIPEGSVVPHEILESIGLEGKLSGRAKNVVRAKKLRGVLSQGIVYPTDKPIGENVADYYGIVRYEPPIPETLRGNVDNNYGKTVKYEIENVKKYPDVLVEGETVRITEKLHGTWTCLGLWDSNTPIVTSKGLSAQGLSFKIDDSNQRNTYVKMWDKYKDFVHTLYESVQPRGVYILGESYGKVQDLRYDLGNQIDFRAFDIYLGPYTTKDATFQGRYYDIDEFDKFFSETIDGQIETVPVIYDGPFNKSTLIDKTRGKSQIASHIREGVVIKAAPERSDDEIGRVILKSVSEDYLLRKNATEFE